MFSYIGVSYYRFIPATIRNRIEQLLPQSLKPTLSGCMYINIPYASPRNKRPALKPIMSMSSPFLLMQQIQTLFEEAVGVEKEGGGKMERKMGREVKLTRIVATTFKYKRYSVCARHLTTQPKKKKKKKIKKKIP